MTDREVIARAIAEATQTAWREGIIRLGGGDYDTDQLNNCFRHQADAVLAALEASGRVIVPVEPTGEMLLAGYAADGTGGCHDFDGPAVYRAMIAAKGQTDGRD